MVVGAVQCAMLQCAPGAVQYGELLGGAVWVLDGAEELWSGRLTGEM